MTPEPSPDPQQLALQRFPATQLRGDVWREIEDELTIEEPLEIRIDGRRYTTTMRTPGDDLELARGLLLSEGVIASGDDIEAISASTRCREGSEELINVVNVTLHESSVAEHLWERNLVSNSSCGLCGKASVEALTARVRPLPLEVATRPDAQELLALPARMRAAQALFSRTGGLHAAALYKYNGALECLALYEDIGRHNATDKAIGDGLEAGWLPWASDEPLVLLVSGRASFEIVQKALMARIAIVCAVSAASTLAVELAQANRVTLVGFLRDTAMTVYCGRQRLAFPRGHGRAPAA